MTTSSYRPIQQLSELPGGRMVILRADGVGSAKFFLGMAHHTPQASHEEVIIRFVLEDGTDVTKDVAGKALTSEEKQALDDKGLRMTYEKTGKIVIDRPASTSFVGDSLGESGLAKLICYREVDLDTPLEDLETFPKDGRFFLMKRTPNPHPPALWTIAKFEFGHIRFRQAGIYPGNAGQMSKFEGWAEIPSVTIDP